MEHILAGCTDFCLGIWVHQHRTCCKHWLYEISWQRINIWGSRDTSATVTVAHTETIKLFKHAYKLILSFYKWPELMWQHNCCNSDPQKVPILESEPVTNPSGCLPEVCKCTWISRGNLIWQFFKPVSSESFSFPFAHKTTLASWTKFSFGWNAACKCSHEAALAGPLRGTEIKTLHVLFHRSEEFIP